MYVQENVIHMFLIRSHLTHQNVSASLVHKLVKSFFLKAGNHFGHGRWIPTLGGPGST